MMRIVFLILIVTISVTAFGPIYQRSRDLKLYEDFRLDKITVISDPLIFSEKQLRENLPEPEPRWNPFASFLPDLSGLFAGEGAKKAASGPNLQGALRSTVSPEVLESRTSDFVKGKIDAKKFANTLEAAFGKKLAVVLPEILATLPADKSAALQKVTR